MKKHTRPIWRKFIVPLLVLSMFVTAAAVLRANAVPVMTVGAAALDDSAKVEKEVSPSDVSPSDTVSSSDLLLSKMLLKAAPLILRTSAAPPDYVGDLQIEFDTDWTIDSTISFLVPTGGAGPVYVHFGGDDDTYVKSDNGAVSGTVKGSTIRVYSPVPIVSFDGSSKKITRLDISKAPGLTYVFCNNNQLTEMDVSNNTALQHLSLYNNQLTELDISHNAELTYLLIQQNRIKLSKLTGITDHVTIDMNDQAIIEDIAIGEVLDLSSEYSLNGAITTFTFKDQYGYDRGQPTDLGGGKFVFEDSSLKNAKRKCYMTNGSLSYSSTTFTILPAPTPDYGDLQIELESTAATVKLSISLASAAKVYVDAGDGPYQAFGGTSASTGLLITNQNKPIKVYTTVDITAISCENQSITRLDVSGAKGLEHLLCSDNNLTELNVSNHESLLDLTCEYNLTLTKINASNNPKLNEFNCVYCQLEELNVDNDVCLSTFWYHGNKLKLSHINYNGIPNAFTGNNQSIIDDIQAGTELDLSSEYSLYGRTTSFSFADSSGNAITTTSPRNGVFVFSNDDAGKRIAGTMTNGNLTVKCWFKILPAPTTFRYYDPCDTGFVTSVAANNVTLTDGTDIDAVELLVTPLDEQSTETLFGDIAEKYTDFDKTTAKAADLTLVKQSDHKTEVKIASGEISVTLSAPVGGSYTFQVYHQDGTAIEKLTDNSLTFTTAKFSPYAVGATPAPSGGNNSFGSSSQSSSSSSSSSSGSSSSRGRGNPGTGESGAVMFAAGALALLSLAAGTAVLVRRRKKH